MLGALGMASAREPVGLTVSSLIRNNGCPTSPNLQHFRQVYEVWVLVVC